MGGVYLSKPITKGQTEYGENPQIAYVTSSAQGWRSSMEGIKKERNNSNKQIPISFFFLPLFF